MLTGLHMVLKTEADESYMNTFVEGAEDEGVYDDSDHGFVQ